MGNDLQTVLLLYSAISCIFRFFGLSSSDTVTTLVQSHLASFLQFPEVIPEILANFYNVDFNVMDPVLDSYRFTGTFNNRQLSQILDYLRISSRIDYSIKRMEMDDSLSAQREQIVLRRIK